MITFGNAISLLKDAQLLAKKLKNRELNDVLLSLQGDLIDLGDQNIKLREKYDELKKYIEIPDDIYLDDDSFICRKNDIRKYCPSCWNKDRRLSLMPKLGYQFLSLDFDQPDKAFQYICSACKYVIYSNKKRLY